jgi:hypothetical protein
MNKRKNKLKKKKQKTRPCLNKTEQKHGAELQSSHKCARNKLLSFIVRDFFFITKSLT